MKISVRNEYIDVAGSKVLIVAEGKTSAGLKVFTGFQIDRKKSRVGGERYYRSDGRDFRGDPDARLLREADPGMSLTDAQAAILERLIEALDTDIAMPGRVGPKMYGNSMPDFLISEAELITLEFVDSHETGGMHTRHRNSAIDADVERRAKRSRERIGRMEEALAWVPSSVWDHEMRVVLFGYAEVKARGWDWSRYIETRNRRQPQKKAWVRRTLYRWIEKSLQQIESELAKNSILLKDTAGLHVAHEEAKSTGKSITSGLLAWTAPDGKPDLRRM
ncbi:hypothetical protein [Ensifer sp. ENS05]|uniref:hypothetical protein n=1 Tax=Ensifer sp. ENS05 TaxID=2769277 RepID=UPI001FEE4BE7|nr:hypothetical protein [Ensifer sp. ENS05]